MSVSAIVPIMSRPTFSPARIAWRTVMFGFTCLTSCTLEEMDILTSIIAPTAPKIMPADRIPVKFQPCEAEVRHNAIPSSKKPNSCASPVSAIACWLRTDNTPTAVNPPSVPSTPEINLKLNPVIRRKVVKVRKAAIKSATAIGL